MTNTVFNRDKTDQINANRHTIIDDFAYMIQTWKSHEHIANLKTEICIHMEYKRTYHYSDKIARDVTYLRNMIFF